MNEVAIPNRSPRALHTPYAFHSTKSLMRYNGFTTALFVSPANLKSLR